MIGYCDIVVVLPYHLCAHLVSFSFHCKMEDGSSNVSSVYIYNGVDEVPMNVTHVRVDPTVTIIPDSAFEDRGSLKEVRVG